MEPISHSGISEIIETSEKGGSSQNVFWFCGTTTKGVCICCKTIKNTQYKYKNQNNIQKTFYICQKCYASHVQPQRGSRQNVFENGVLFPEPTTIVKKVELSELII